MPNGECCAHFRFASAKVRTFTQPTKQFHEEIQSKINHKLIITIEYI